MQVRRPNCCVLNIYIRLARMRHGLCIAKTSGDSQSREHVEQSRTRQTDPPTAKT